MVSISYFFNLFDDKGTGRVDREGILSMSEALLFLSRRGFEGTLTPSDSSSAVNELVSTAEPDIRRDSTKLSTSERFLGSVSAFIRRCFEYADPDHHVNQKENTSSSEPQVEDKLDAFTIGEDEDEEDDLLDFLETPANAKSPLPKTVASPIAVSSDPLSESTPPGSPPLTARPTLITSDSTRSQSRLQARATSHNLALDPENPLHITLPTFRMVILADELLEQFFESFFPQSFHLSGIPDSRTTSSPASTLSGNLTTFTNLGQPVKNLMTGSSSSKEGLINVGRAGGIVEPGSRGLRGVLDNIVNDGMRMAAEMRKRMDEAQREYDRANASQRKDEDDEDEEFDEKAAARRDQDLLEGAEVASIKTVKSDMATLQSEVSVESKVGSTEEEGGPSLLDSSTTKSVEFES